MTDLATLFARDPLSLSDQDIDIIVHKLREARANFKLEPAKPAKQKTPTVDLAALGLISK